VSITQARMKAVLEAADDFKSAALTLCDEISYFCSSTDESRSPEERLALIAERVNSATYYIYKYLNDPRHIETLSLERERLRFSVARNDRDRQKRGRSPFTPNSDTQGLFGEGAGHRGWRDPHAPTAPRYNPLEDASAALELDTIQDFTETISGSPPEGEGEKQ